MKDYIEMTRNGKRILVRVRNIKMLQQNDTGTATLTMDDGWVTDLDDRYDTLAEAITEATASPMVSLASLRQPPYSEVSHLSIADSLTL